VTPLTRLIRACFIFLVFRFFYCWLRFTAEGPNASKYLDASPISTVQPPYSFVHAEIERGLTREKRQRKRGPCVRRLHPSIPRRPHPPPVAPITEKYRVHQSLAPFFFVVPETGERRREKDLGLFPATIGTSVAAPPASATRRRPHLPLAVFLDSFASVGCGRAIAVDVRRESRGDDVAEEKMGGLQQDQSLGQRAMDARHPPCRW
jgi:hypothetical protein